MLAPEWVEMDAEFTPSTQQYCSPTLAHIYTFVALSP